MSENKPPKALPSGGVFQDAADYLKLILRLIGDKRVSLLLKLIPIGALIYLLMPGPVPPDMLPGPLDDAGIVGLGLFLFVELCPPDVVEEHRQAIRRVIPGQWRDTASPEDCQDDVIDAEFHEEKPPQ